MLGAGVGYRSERDVLIKGGILLALAIALPLIYGNAINGHHLWHVLANASATWLCCFLAFSSKGPTTARLNMALVTAVAVHGILILAILLFRTYYSRQLVIAALMTSLLLSTGLVMLSKRLRLRRVGIVPVGLTEELRQWAGGPQVTLLTSAAVPVSDYDLILINFSSKLNSAWARFAANAMLASSCEVRHVVRYVEERRGRVSPDHFEPEHAASPVLQRYVTFYKRPLDIILALGALTFALPVLLAAAGAILATMRGPALFTQDRIGRGGRVFKIYKLRTMRPRLPGEPDTATAVNDPRITPLGKWLRRVRIDELPQIYNVLKGDMSFIGPRPEQPELAKCYSEIMPSFVFRHMLRPGITGWAQVQAGYAANETETREKLSFDLYYVKYASWLLDLQILLRSVVVVAGLKEVR